MAKDKKGGIGKTFKKVGDDIKKVSTNVGNDIKKFGEKVGSSIVAAFKSMKKIKIRPPKKQHTIRNKKRKIEVKKKKEVNKKDPLKYTKLLTKQWKTISFFYIYILILRFIVMENPLSHSFSYYIQFILFFTLQYFGYTILLIMTLFSIESIILMTSTTLMKAIRRLFEKFKRHNFLKNYPLNDYFWTHLLPRGIHIGFILFGIFLLIILFFIFIIPSAILLLGYTK
jgi:hypothetical protein